MSTLVLKLSLNVSFTQQRGKGFSPLGRNFCRRLFCKGQYKPQVSNAFLASAFTESINSNETVNITEGSDKELEIQVKIEATLF